MAHKRSTSKKSASATNKQPKLKVTLKRKPKIRDLDETDLKYLWLAYKTGSFTKAGSFEIPEGLTPIQFNETAYDLIMESYTFGWALTSKDGERYGYLFAEQAGPITLLGDVIWLPNVTNRQKIESAVNTINELKKDLYLNLYCDKTDNDFYLHVARHGILKRVGHLHFTKEHMILWESR